MGINQGQISVCRYRLVGTRNLPSLGKLNSLIEPYKAQAVKLTGVPKEELVSWAAPKNPGAETNQAAWDLSDCRTDEGFWLRMRVERRRIPSGLLDVLLQQEAQQGHRRDSKKLGAKGIRELRERLKGNLLTRVLPAITWVDAFWNCQTQELWVFSAAKRIRALFESHFRKSFADPLGFALVAVEPPLLGLSPSEWSNTDSAHKTLDRLSHAMPLGLGQTNI